MLQSIFLFILCLLWTSSAWAATFYVATTGSDGNNCAQAQSVSTPKQTIPAGIVCMSAGDTVQVRAGTYLGQTIENIPSGSDSAYSIVRNFPGERPIIGANGAFQRGFMMDNGASEHHWEIRGFEFSGLAGSEMLYNIGVLFGTEPTNYPHHLRFIDNVSHDTVQVGILNASNIAGTQGGDHYIAQNEFYRIGAGSPGYVPGINVLYGTGNNAIIEDNIFHNNCTGVAIFTGSTNIFDVIARRNVFYDMARGAATGDDWQIGQDCSITSVVVVTIGGRHKIYNNITYNSNGVAYTSYFGPNDVKFLHNTCYNILDGADCINGGGADATNVVCRNNIAYLTGGITGCDTTSNNLTTNPLFVNAATANFHLQSGSPAINAGTTVTEVTADFAGTLRPQGSAYDIGAYEFVNGSGSGMLPPTGLTAQ